MKLTKECFIHSKITFDSTEKDVLTTTRKIIENICFTNTHSSGAEDDYLREKCEDILKGIDELLDNYTNEYPDK